MTEWKKSWGHFPALKYPPVTGAREIFRDVYEGIRTIEQVAEQLKDQLGWTLEKTKAAYEEWRPDKVERKQ
jgi:hypothetical protein